MGLPPERYHLIFGAPIHGYVIPYKHVLPSATRTLSALVGVIDALRQARRLNAPDFPPSIAARSSSGLRRADGLHFPALVVGTPTVQRYVGPGGIAFEAHFAPTTISQWPQ